jgi:ataxia telangiectasia mutated family protein
VTRQAQEAFTDLLSDVKLALRAALGPEPATNTADSQSTEDGDDFGEARPSDVDTHQYLTDSAKGESYFTAISVEVCFAVLTVGPMIQSKSSEPTRDKTLIDLTLDASDQHFETLGLPLFDTVRRRKLYLGLANMDKFLHRFDTLLRTHASSRRESMQLLAISFLDSTSHTWLDEKNRGEEVASKVRALCFWLTEMLAENKITSWKIRDRLVRFLDRYIRHDPLETFWKYDDGDMVDDNVLPSSILPALGDDADVRVRFRVAVLCAKLFHFAEYTDTDPMQLYDSIRKKLGVRIDKYVISICNYFNLLRLLSRRENMLTRFLALGNIMVASSAVRRGPYWHLIETFFYTVDYSSHIEAVLAAVSERLGLPALRNLFEAYASQIVFSAFTSSKDFARVPSHILGYSDRREYSEASFILICPTFLLAGGGNPEAVALGEQLFENQCRAAQKTIEEGLNDCFGDLVGLQIAFYFEDNVDGEDLSASVSQGGSDFLKLSIENRARACDSNEDATVFIRKNVDRIVFSMVRSLLDMDISREGAIVAALQSEPDSARAVRAFRSLASYRKGEDFRVHSPNKPGVSAITILRSIRWLSKLAPDAMSKETVYHVLHHLFAAADRSPLVNEQIRLLNATCLLCALNNSAFEDVIVLRTLILGSVAMLSQFDLAAAAQCILEWSFQFYRTTDIRDPCFPDVLSRIGRIASDYASEANVACHTLGERLMDWIEKLASGLHSVDTLRPQILSALPLWPRPPTGDLAELARDLDSDNVSHILKDQNVTSSKFRLVRRLRDLAFVEGAPLQEFSRHDFWHLKAHIPPSEILQDEDIDAFVALLYANKGQIQTVSDNRSSIRAVDVRHQRATRTSKGEFRQTPSAISIVTSLFDMLSSDTMSQVHVAYMTLRHIAAVNSSMRSDSQKWPAEIKPEVRFYSDNPLAALWRPKRSLQELEHDKYLETTSNFTTWITCVTLLFSDVLSETDMLYAQLTDILQSDTVFAEHMLPVLVCDLLVTDFRSDPPVTTCRASLSGFFTRILRLQSAALQCVSAVVEVVLHLRNFDQPAQTDKLGYNQWLDVDFTLLAQGAMSCGAYTTALLFLELAREYEESPDVAQRPTLAEDILFNIYSHIDEPDGFYGIQTKDVSKFLLRRFHHEKQWGKAFQFLGANLEAESGTSQNAPGVLQSLHSFGFHKLAMTVLQSSGSGTGDGERQSSGLGYDLGWRTETWDLPNPDLNEHPTGALYSALRAVHRERDSDAIDTTIRRALRHEVLRLRSFGNEDMTQIREATRSLMCLGEITNWRGSSIQDKLQRRDMDHPSWSNFCSLSSEFE